MIENFTLHYKEELYLHSVMLVQAVCTSHNLSNAIVVAVCTWINLQPSQNNTKSIDMVSTLGSEKTIMEKTTCISGTYICTSNL